MRLRFRTAACLAATRRQAGALLAVILLAVCASAIVGLLTLTATAAAQDCLDYRDYPHQIGRLPLFSPPADVTLYRDHAYVCGTWASEPYSICELVVIDISNPAVPSVVRSVNLPASPRGMVLADRMLYLALDHAGLQIWDLADPASPQVVGIVDTPGAAWSVAVAGDHAFVADVSGGLQIVDVSDPLAPAIVGQLVLFGARDVALSGDLALVTGGELRVVDVSNVEAPSLLATLAFSEPASEVAVSGAMSYVLSHYGSMRTVDLSDPAHPVVVGEVEFGAACGLVISGQYAFCGCYGVNIVDVSDPTSPHVVGRAPIGPSPNYVVHSLAIRDEVIFVACESPSQLGMFEVLRQGNPVMPVPLAQLDVEGRLGGVTATADYAYLLADPAGLLVIEIGDPPAPHVVGQLTLSGAALRISVSGDWACLTVPPGYGAPSPILQVVNISMPDNPWPRATLDTPGQAYDVAMSGSCAYVADGTAGLQIVSLTDPAHPQILGSLPCASGAMCVAASDNLVFLTVGDSLLVVDATDPAAPRRLGAAWGPPGISPQGLAVSDALGWLLTGSALVVYDLSKPESPTLLGLLPAYPTGTLWGVSVAVDAGLAYHQGVGAAQISGVSSDGPPVALGWLGVSSGAAIALSDDRVLMFGHRGYSPGTIRLDIMPRQCDVSVPTFLTAFTAEVWERGVCIRWVVSGPSTPDEFLLAGHRGESTWQVSFQRDGVDGYAASDARALLGGGGEVTYELRHREGDGAWRTLGTRTLWLDLPAAGTQLLALHPNPANPRVSVTFSLDRAQRIELTAYDFAGRRVARLADGALAAGVHDVEWDGRDGAGREVASGSYVVRLRTERGVDARKLMLIR